MQKILLILTVFIFTSTEAFSHDEEKMNLQVEKCSLEEAWFSEELDLAERIKKLRIAVSENEEESLPIPQLDEQNKEILKKLETEESPEEISRLIARHMEISQTAEVYSRNKLIQLNIILILILNVFVITIIFLAFISKSSKRKAQKEKRLNTQILAAQERERRRIAQELHDTITQDIRTALLYIRELKESPSDTELTDKIENLETQNLKNLRNIIQNLTSAEIETEDFGDLISRHCASVSENRSINCSFFAAPDVDFSKMNTIQKLNILRIIQEAVNNSLKHAKASSISIIVRKDLHSEKLIFFISDDGQGFEAAAMDQKSGKQPAEMSSHFGLTGMKNRAEMINADFKLSSSAEMGTEIKLTVPVK